MMEAVSGRLSKTKPTPSLIHHFLENSAKRFPDQIAVVHESKRVTYDQVNLFANQLAHRLIEAGVCRNERVVFICENGLEYIFCYYGILKAGGWAVSLNTELKSESISELLNELEPKVLIISSKFEKSFHSLDLSPYHIQYLFILNPRLAWPSSGYEVSSLYEDFSHQPNHNPELDIDHQSIATIIYTSGSAGKPKGVMLTHANITANTQAIIEYLDLTSNDIQMVVLPFFYVMGKSLLNTHFAVGGRVVINNKFAYTAAVLKQMAEERVTGFSGVPSTYAHLLFKSPLAQYRDKLPFLRYCSQAGGHMPKHIKLELIKILPRHTRLIVMYGATEASARLTYDPPYFLSSKIDSIGKPISGVSIRILSPEGMLLRTGGTGELVAQGKNIMSGYYKDEETTKRVLDHHGYHTGDLGYYDQEGFFYITGRKDNQIKAGGHRLHPQEIEDVIIESGLVSECLIFGIKDLFGTDQLAGLAVPLAESMESSINILKFCSTKLPKYKVPESLLLVAAIPKNSNGKPDLHKSLELFRKEYNYEGRKSS
jgi:long-chain acyl-CoA synthetase